MSWSIKNQGSLKYSLCLSIWNKTQELDGLYCLLPNARAVRSTQYTGKKQIIFRCAHTYLKSIGVSTAQEAILWKIQETV